MTLRTSGSSPARSSRPGILVALDVAAGIAISFFGVIVALVVYINVSVFTQFTSECGAGQFDGVICNEGYLTAVIVGGIVLTVLGMAFGIGMFIVSLVQRRYGFWWPLAGVVIVIGAFYLASLLASMVAP